MEQIIKWVIGTDFSIATSEINKLTQELNKEGFKLTFATNQCQNNHFYEPTEFMLVFTKE